MLDSGFWGVYFFGLKSDFHVKNITKINFHRQMISKLKCHFLYPSEAEDAFYCHKTGICCLPQLGNRPGSAGHWEFLLTPHLEVKIQV